MRRGSLEAKLMDQPLYAKLLHECWACHAAGCHAAGLKPGVVETHPSVYGLRMFLATVRSCISQ